MHRARIYVKGRRAGSQLFEIGKFVGRVNYFQDGLVGNGGNVDVGAGDEEIKIGNDGANVSVRPLKCPGKKIRKQIGEID